MRLSKAVIVALLLPLGFAGGFFVNRALSDNAVHLSPSAKASAEQASKLQQHIIEVLQAEYYKKVDVGKLGQAGVDGMLGSLHDPWTEYLTPQEVSLMNEQTEGRYSGIGAMLQKTDNKLLITGVLADSPAKGAGLKAGDQILTVNGVSTKGRSLEASIASIKGVAGTQVTLTVLKADTKLTVTLTLTRRQLALPLTATKLLTAANGVKVGYVELADFAKGAGQDVRRDIDKLRAQGAAWIVFDLRYNGGGLLSEAVDVGSDFIKQGTIVTTQGLHSPKEVLQASGNGSTSLPVVVLMNGYTASASEIVCGALQDYRRAYLIGTTTFGKGLVQRLVDLPGGAALKLTIAVYLTPKGRDINKKGIVPDQVVKDNLKTKRDEVLQAALRYIAAQN